LRLPPGLAGVTTRPAGYPSGGEHHYREGGSAYLWAYTDGGRGAVGADDPLDGGGGGDAQQGVARRVRRAGAQAVRAEHARPHGERQHADGERAPAAVHGPRAARGRARRAGGADGDGHGAAAPRRVRCRRKGWRYELAGCDAKSSLGGAKSSLGGHPSATRHWPECCESRPMQRVLVAWSVAKEEQCLRAALRPPAHPAHFASIAADRG
jgi:hypothetical protein